MPKCPFTQNYLPSFSSLKARGWDVTYGQNPEKNDLFWKSVANWAKPFSYKCFRHTLSLLIRARSMPKNLTRIKQHKLI